MSKKQSKITKKDRARYWQKRINKMLDSNGYRFAKRTLVSIGEYIAEHEHITDNQIEAVKNISNSRY